MDIKKVIILLSKDTLSSKEVSLLTNFLHSENNWGSFLELLSFHKLLSRAYYHFKANNLEDFLPRHILLILQNHYHLTDYRRSLTEDKACTVINEMNKSKIRYCIIKSFPLSNDLFSNSIRESSDIDILIRKEDIRLVDTLLQNCGFIQGVFNNDHNIEKSRQKEIAFLMTTHQTLPYCLTTKCAVLPIVRIDLQYEFTLQKKLKYNIDYEVVFQKSKECTIKKNKIYVLDNFDNFLMLCTHLHGEAVIFSEICKGKDLQLSKIADIFQWLQKYAKNYCWDEKIKTIMEYNMQIPVAYSMYLVYIVYQMETAKNILDKLGIADYSFVDYYYNENNELTRWDKPVLERMFCTTRPKRQRG